jgi:hypothetical protein
MRTRTRTAVVGGLVVLGLALGGCSTIQSLIGGGQNVTRDAESQEVTEAGTADVFTLQVGDCFDDEGGAEEVMDVPAVPCAEPHDNEVYYEFSLAGDEFPGEDAIRAEAEAECTPAFEEFVGMAYADSALDWFPFYPTEGSWNEMGDRVVQCAIYDGSLAKVQGSLAGVAR